MAEYFTKAEARAFGSSTIHKSVRTNDSGEDLRKAFHEAKDTDRFDIFLSHASKDAELILGVKRLLEKLGFSVYVDWVDDAHLDKSQVNREHADLLRQRMRQSSSLVWVATDAASTSKWMPWVLGYFDGFKPNHVAVLPLVDNPGDTFKGQEYLMLYAVVRKDTYQNSQQQDVFVEDLQGRKWTTLRGFGKGGGKWSPYSQA